MRQRQAYLGLCHQASVWHADGADVTVRTCVRCGCRTGCQSGIAAPRSGGNSAKARARSLNRSFARSTSRASAVITRPGHAHGIVASHPDS